MDKTDSIKETMDTKLPIAHSYILSKPPRGKFQHVSRHVKN
jgi:hypothetical protein